MRVTCVVLLAFVALFALRRHSAALRHWVLSVALVLAGLTPALGLLLPEWHLPLTVTPGIERLAWAAPQTTGRDAPPRAETAAITLPGGSRPVSAAEFSQPPTRVGTWLRRAWIAGTSVSLLLILVGFARLAWLASSARQLSRGRWVEQAREISAQCGLRRPVRLLQSDHPTLLVTWGVLAPIVILPSVARTWTEDRMRIVLWHELAHIRRGDWFTQMAAELLRAIYWFNPLVWVACRRLRQESEQACDDEVLGRGVEGAEYAEALLALARDLNQARLAWLPAPAMARPSSLERRVHTMLNARIDRTGLGIGGRAFTILALLLLTIPIAAAQTFATFSGAIVDPTGAVLPDAKLTLLNSERKSKYEVRSGPTGAFEFVGLPSGIYELEAQQLGFATFHATVSLASGETLQRRVTLELGSLEESITISDEADAPPPVAKRDGPLPVTASACVPAAAGGSIRAPRKIYDVHPLFPPGLRGTGAEGVVLLDTTIGLDGYVKDIQVLNSPDPALASSAIAAVKEWRFTQTLLNCAPQEVHMKVTTRFVHRR